MLMLMLMVKISEIMGVRRQGHLYLSMRPCFFTKQFDVILLVL
jgi:hypothetical protein